MSVSPVHIHIYGNTRLKGQSSPVRLSRALSPDSPQAGSDDTGAVAWSTRRLERTFDRSVDDLDLSRFQSSAAR